MAVYTQEWYRTNQEGARRSARAIVPLVLDLVQPRRVVDVGCGLGTWLSVFRELGVEDVVGVDGDYVETAMLEIPVERFHACDLENPFQLETQFDLVVSLEVAEHLSRESAESFIESLTRLGPVIVFSAAIPFQGGLNHINEQWPEYWAGLFQKRGFAVVDCLRKQIWQNEGVEWWYAQNILMFVQEDYLAAHPTLKREAEKTAIAQLSVIHPRKYLSALPAPTMISAGAAPAAPAIRLVVTGQEGSVRALPADLRTALPIRQATISWDELRRYLGTEFRCEWISDKREFGGMRELPAGGQGEEPDRAFPSLLYALTVDELSGDRDPSRVLLRSLIPAPASVLDYRCGIGGGGLRLLNDGYTVHFAESHGSGSDYLQWRLAKRGVEASIHDPARAALPRVDVALCWNVTQQVEEPQALLRGLESVADLVIATFIDQDAEAEQGTIRHPRADLPQLIAGIRERYPVLGADRSAGSSGRQLVTVAYFPGIERPVGKTDLAVVDLSDPSPLGEQLRSAAGEVVWLLEGGKPNAAAARWHLAFHQRRQERWAVATGPTWPHPGALNVSVKRSFLLETLRQVGLDAVAVDAATVEAALALAGGRSESLPVGAVGQMSASTPSLPADHRARSVWLGAGAGRAVAGSRARMAAVGVLSEPDLAASVLVVGEGDDPNPLLQTLSVLAEEWRDDWELVLVSRYGEACKAASLYLEGDFQLVCNSEPVGFEVALNQAALAARGRCLIIPTAAGRLSVARQQFLMGGGVEGLGRAEPEAQVSPRAEPRPEPELARC